MNYLRFQNFNKNLLLHFEGKNLDLPLEFQNNIDQYWDCLMKEGKQFFRGDIFIVNRVEDSFNNLDIYLQQSDYAYLVYCHSHDIPKEFTSRVVCTSGIAETTDNKFILGLKGEHTLSGQKLQFTGGVLDKSDLVGDYFDLESSLKREAYEELGIDAQNKKIVEKIQPYTVIEGGKYKSLIVIFRIKLSISSHDMQELFNNHINKLHSLKQTPEFSEIVFINCDEKSVKSFIENDKRRISSYVKPVLQSLYCSKSIELR